MEELTLQPQAKHSIWDDYVPVLQHGRHTDVYITDNIEAPSEYNKICHILRNAYTGDTITLYINSGGGYIDSAFAIVDAIRSTKAVVKAHLAGTVASAATMIALTCHSIEIAKHVQFMIHNYSGGASGKGHEIKSHVDFTDKALNEAFTDLYSGFLTENEMELVIAGKDFWMGRDEVLARLTARDTESFVALDTIASERKGKVKGK